MASPVLVLRCDGAFYDVVALEERWGLGPRGADFHRRVFAMKAAGLDEVDQRLRAGDRPTEARILPRDMVALSPVDGERALALACGPDVDGQPPRLCRLDARQAVGPGLPVPVPEGAARVHAGVALVVGEELARARAREAARAVVGVVPYLRWTVRDDPWEGGALVPDGPLQLGPVLGWRLRPRDTVDATLEVDGAEVDLAAPAAAHDPAERVAYASHVVALRPGDVLALPPRAVAPVPPRRRVRWRVGKLGPLEGWPTTEPPPPAWRR